MLWLYKLPYIYMIYKLTYDYISWWSTNSCTYPLIKTKNKMFKKSEGKGKRE